MIKNRTRKIDLENYKTEELDQIGLELGKRVGQITENAKTLVEKLVKPYGFEIQIQILMTDPKTGKVFTPT